MSIIKRCIEHGIKVRTPYDYCFSCGKPLYPDDDSVQSNGGDNYCADCADKRRASEESRMEDYND